MSAASTLSKPDLSTRSIYAWRAVGIITSAHSESATVTAKDFLARPAHEIEFELQRGARVVAFQYVVSLFFLTLKRNAPLQFIPAGESPAMKSLPWTLITLIVGWWGIPWGFIYTPQVLYKNLKGGVDVTPQIKASLGLPATPQSL